MSQEHRLERLEARYPAVHGNGSDRAHDEMLARNAAIDEMLESIRSDRETHECLDVETLDDLKSAQVERLESIMLYMISTRVRERSQRRMAMPEPVLEAYLDDPRLKPRHDCESCGLILPTLTGIAQVADQEGRVHIPPAISTFTRCPLCGGRVGHELYRLARYGEIRACGECGELIAHNDDEARHVRNLGRLTCNCKGVTR